MLQMKRPAFLRAGWVFVLTVSVAYLSPAQDSLPKYITVQLKQLEETWNILDQVSTKVWPGWTGYADLPFLFVYPNGVQMLVGYPEPPDGFSVVAGAGPRGKSVFLDRRKEVPVSMPLPMSGGGGPIPFG